MDHLQTKYRQQQQQPKRPSSLNDAERLAQRDDNVTRKFSFRRSDGILSYRDDDRPSKPTWTDNKSSLLRYSKNSKPDVISSEFLRNRKSTISRLISSSLSDLRHASVVRSDLGGGREDNDADRSPGELVRQNSTPSNLGV